MSDVCLLAVLAGVDHHHVGRAVHLAAHQLLLLPTTPLRPAQNPHYDKWKDCR